MKIIVNGREESCPVELSFEELFRREEDCRQKLQEKNGSERQGAGTQTREIFIERLQN